MWMIALEFLKGIPWGKVLPLLAVLTLVVGGFLYVDNLRDENEKLKLQIEVLNRDYGQCKANREAQDEIIAEYSKNAEDAAKRKEELDEALDRIATLVASLIKAKAQLADVSKKYDKLRQEAGEIPLCATYENVLRAMAGEE